MKRVGIVAGLYRCPDTHTHAIRHRWLCLSGPPEEPRLFRAHLGPSRAVVQPRAVGAWLVQSNAERLGAPMQPQNAERIVQPRLEERARACIDFVAVLVSQRPSAEL